MIPNLLIIGAMKCGTTTLHGDLSLHPEICMSKVKEPEILLSSDEKKIKQGYQDLFSFSRKFYRYYGEASTAYTKHVYSDLASNIASNYLDDGCKLIFLYRDPVKRAVSQARHDYAHGEVGLDDLMSDSYVEDLINNSDYNECILPWAKRFSRDNILIIEFEEYISNKKYCLDAIFDFLGVEKNGYPYEESLDVNLNSSEKRVVLNSFIKSLTIDSRLYQYKLKKHIPENLRKFGADMLSKKEKKEIDRPHLVHLEERLRDAFGGGCYFDIKRSLRTVGEK